MDLCNIVRLKCTARSKYIVKTNREDQVKNNIHLYKRFIYTKSRKFEDIKGGLVRVQLFKLRDGFVDVGRIVDHHIIGFILLLTISTNTTCNV